MNKRRSSVDTVGEKSPSPETLRPKMSQGSAETADPLDLFHPAVKQWFTASFGAPTAPQAQGWPAIAQGDSTLILAPTGTGKTLAAFLWCINRLMFEPKPEPRVRCRVLYISPIKALAVDVERNLRAPLIGISKTAERLQVSHHVPQVWVRSGDTPASERARFQRSPSDILITTPESLYLMLTSNAREALRSIDTVIVDEIHAVVPTKRGAHLALSLERLEALCGRRIQRIGLSATQRPLEEVATFLGGAEKRDGTLPKGKANAQQSDDPAEIEQELSDEFEVEMETAQYRQVAVVNTGQRKKLELKIEVPVEDMAAVSIKEEVPSGPAGQAPKRISIWTAIHPKLLELVRAHQTTLIFVNNRRLAERISAALNDLAGEVIVRAHHGSLALAQRKEVEERLKLGTIKGLIATSSLELGIDMGAVDLVVQIEAPPSVASGMQRIGRASHQVDAVSKGVIFPKFRADLVACAAVTRAMREGQVESIRYPRNPLDVLSQQIVAMVGMEDWKVDDLFDRIRRAAPYVNLNRSVFESVLDMLAGRYPSDEFADLRPRLTWDRVQNLLTARQGARSLAIVNGGTIPDRGLYGVFLLGAETGSTRVGELDEEMVFESRLGDTFLLGASTWRIEEITHDRVLVSPAPGEPGKMPFWHGDAAGRPLEFGEEIGRLVRELREMPHPAAISRLVREHDLDQNAAENLLRYLIDQAAATTVVPDDRNILIERCRDEMGDWRICVLTHFGSRLHAPWCMAVTAKIRNELGVDVEVMWTDDGFVVRLPESDEPPGSGLFAPGAAEVERLLLGQLGSTALFAAKFREVASRALLLPKRRPGTRAPLWQLRKRAATLLGVAARYGSFPMVLESYRECLRDVFDIPALLTVLRRIGRRDIHVTTVDSPQPSPFAATLLFSYVANYIYEGDAPLAERRAQALSIDQAQLRELLGDADFRELLDAEALEEAESQLQALDAKYRARNIDGLHDLLRRLGDLARDEIVGRSNVAQLDAALTALEQSRRAIILPIGGEKRYIAAEDAARYRDALGVPLPQGLPEAFTRPVASPVLELVRRYARTHGPFTTQDVVARFGLSRSAVESVLKKLLADGKVMEGEFRPGGIHREWCDAEVLRTIRRKSLARLRREVEPVEQQVFARMLTHWQGLLHPRSGLDALLDAIENLQGAAFPASIVESEILPARVREYSPADLDTLIAAGEVVWCGVESLGERDGRIALFLADHLAQLWRLRDAATPELSERERKIVEVLTAKGALFFAAIHEAAGGGYPGETQQAIWDLVWKGLITSDTFQALRSFTHKEPTRKDRAGLSAPGSVAISARGFRSRRADALMGQGRWSLISSRMSDQISATQFAAATAQQLLVRYGVLTREAAMSENLPGGFSTIYPVLKEMEESGRVRRGLFIAGLGATQFAMPAALDLVRSLRDTPERAEVAHVAATDPANPYGTVLRWPALESEEANVSESTTEKMLARSVGASVILVNGSLTAYLRRRNPEVLVFLPSDEPERSAVARALAEKLEQIALLLQKQKKGLLIGSINGVSAVRHFLAPFLEKAGFVATAMGFQMRRAEPSFAGESLPTTDQQPA